MEHLTDHLTLYSIVTPLKYHKFEKNMENGALQMLHFSCFFQIYDISKALLWSKGLSGLFSVRAQ